MLLSLQQGQIRNGNIVSGAEFSLRKDLLDANIELLLGLLIIPTLSGVVLIT